MKKIILNKKTLFGCEIQPYLIKQTDLDNKDANLITRLLPFISTDLANNLTVYCSEADKMNFKFGSIAAQPDAVLSHPMYDISIEFKSKAGSKQRSTNGDNWHNLIRLKDILQTVIASLQVSAVRKKPCLAILRYMDCAFTISPSPEFVKIILEQAPKVQLFKKEGNDKFIAAGVLAEYLEIEIRKAFNSNDEAKEKGKIIHDKMLTK